MIDPMTEFLKEFPGPYAFAPARNGVDVAYDVYCQSTKSLIVAVHYFLDDTSARCIASAITYSLEKARLGAIGKEVA